MTLRYGVSLAATRALEAWRIATRGLPPTLVTMPKDVLHGRQHGRCYLCAAQFAARGRRDGPQASTRDHVFPRVTGAIAEANILLAHKTCNNDKADRWPYPCEVIFLASIYLARP